MQVQEIILHKILEHERSFSVVYRTSVLAINQQSEQMMLSLHQSYQSKSKGFGFFKNDSVFAKDFNCYLERELDLVGLSQRSVDLLVQEMEQYSFTHEGTFIVCRYRFLATDYLLFALIDTGYSVLLDSDLEVKQAQYLDLGALDIICRINITEMQTNAQSNRYVSFAKGRVGRKVADFFLDFLGVEIGLDPKIQNQNLVNALCDYTTTDSLESGFDAKKKAFAYCQSQQRAGKDISLAELSGEIGTLGDKSFSQFAKEHDYELDEQISPVPSALKSLAKFSGAGRGVSISFETQLLGERVIWDREHDTLLIKNLPPNLKEQLYKHLP